MRFITLKFHGLVNGRAWLHCTYGLNCVPPKIHVKALNSKVTVFRGEAF